MPTIVCVAWFGLPSRPWQAVSDNVCSTMTATVAGKVVAAACVRTDGSSNLTVLTVLVGGAAPEASALLDAAWSG
jgi:hypothetical protein